MRQAGGRQGWPLSKLGIPAQRDLLDVLTESAREFLDGWFEDDSRQFRSPDEKLQDGFRHLPEERCAVGLTGGDIIHGTMGLGQLWAARPVLGHGVYRSPIRGLYMCGSGIHPGGGVTGAPGHNAAHEVLRDRSLLGWLR